MYRSRFAALRTAAVLGLLAALGAFVIVSVGEAASMRAPAPHLRSGLSPQSAGHVQLETETDPRRAVRVIYPGLVAAR